MSKAEDFMSLRKRALLAEPGRDATSLETKNYVEPRKASVVPRIRTEQEVVTSLGDLVNKWLGLGLASRQSLR